MANCNYCKRELDQPGDKTTMDCGGDCVKCMAEIAEDPDCVRYMKHLAKEAKKRGLPKNPQLQT